MPHSTIMVLEKKTLHCSHWDSVVFISVVPVLNVFSTATVVADRYAYLPIFGLGLLSAYLLKIIVPRNSGFSYVAFGIILVWSLIDFNRNMDWHSEVTLWKSAVSANPNMSRVNLALAYWDEGQYEALACLKKKKRYPAHSVMTNIRAGTSLNRAATVTQLSITGRHWPEVGTHLKRYIWI